MLSLEIEVLLEILLSVGVTTDIDESTRIFLDRNIRILNRAAGAIVKHEVTDAKSAQVLASIPRSFTDSSEVSEILRNARSAFSAEDTGHYHEDGDTSQAHLTYDVFAIPGFGSLILYGKPLEVDAVFYGHFNLILKKFADSCHACLLRSENEQQSRRLELATKAAKIGAWELNIESGNLIIDDRTRGLLGIVQAGDHFTLDQFLGVVHEEDKATVGAHISNYITQSIDEPTEYYYRIRRNNGEVHKLAANARLLFDKGKPVKVVGVFYDITAAELIRTKSMYRSQLESLLVSLSVDLIKNRGSLDQVVSRALQKAGKFVGADRAYRFEYDFQAETASNTHEWCSEGITPEMDNLQQIPITAMRLWVSAHKSGLPFFVRNVQELPEGNNLRELLEPQSIRSLVTIPLMNHSDCVGFIGFDAVNQERLWTDVDLTLLRLLADLLVNADIRTQHEFVIEEQNLALTHARDHAQMLAEKARQANAAKSKFVARVSHEIRTPLHAILGLTDLMLEQQPDQYIQELTTTIKDSGAILLDLINDVLDFSKAESNEVVLNLADFRITDLLAALEKMFRPLTEKKHLDLDIQISGQVRQAYHGDQPKIRQVLTNLLSNAIKFTIKGGVSIEVEVESQSDTLDVLVFKVADTGMGIPESDMEKLFLPFFQSKNTESLMVSGTGLGLPISRALADRMDGTITVASCPDIGSEFCLHIPLPPASTDAESDPASAEEMLASFTDRIAVLVAEDNPINTQLIRAYLKDLPGELVCVTDGQQAYDAALNRPEGFNIILMDCNMPVMDGYDATRAIRASERRGLRSPIIAVTAGALAGEKDQALEAGMDDVLVKPFTKAELLTLVYRFARNNC